MIYKPYKSTYKSRIIEIFKSNCPKYFDINDEKYLIDFLDNYTDENYLVVFNLEKIVGCGGYYTKDKMHGIAWAMFERNSIGFKELLGIADEFYCEIENRILTEDDIFDIYINTTQLLEKMFNRYQFETYEVIKNGFGKGLDEYKMKKQLTTT